MIQKVNTRNGQLFIGILPNLVEPNCWDDKSYDAYEMRKEQINLWNEIKNHSDVLDFMNRCFYFHDSCVKELKYISGAYVNEDLSMYPTNDLRILRMIIQRQSEEHPVIELEFSGLNYIKMFPADENYTSEILDSTIILKSDCIYWCDCGGIKEEDLASYQGITICASKLRWRIVEGCIGSKEVYVFR